MDSNSSDLVFMVGLFFVFIVLNAAFVAVEFALVSVRQTRLKQLIDSGDRKARCIDALKENQTSAIAGAQLGVTLASLAIGWIGEGSIHRVFLILLNKLPGFYLERLPDGASLFLAFLFMSSLHVVLGEQVPKVLALRMPLSLLSLLVVPFRIFYIISAPIIFVLDRCTALIMCIARVHSIEEDVAISSSEYPHLFIESELAGEIEDGERLLLLRALRWSDSDASERMIPWDRVDYIEQSATLRDVIQMLASTKHSRLPVYDSSIDRVVGVLYAKDLFDLWLSNDSCSLEKQFKLSRIARDAFFVPNTKDAFELFEDMRVRHYQMAIVQDAFENTAGIITQEDLLEHLVGSIEDEYDQAPRVPLIQREAGRWLVRGVTPISVLNKALKLNLDSQTGQSTVAGLFIETFESDPGVGDAVVIEDIRLTVSAMEDCAISSLTLERTKQ